MTELTILMPCLNEAETLAVCIEKAKGFLREAGVSGEVLVADNGSTDGTEALLRAEPDVSLWQTGASYKAARFGMDWLTWLQLRHGHGHWCLTLDADEILIYPYWDSRDLRALTAWLDAQGRPMFGAMMLDLYPKVIPGPPRPDPIVQNPSTREIAAVRDKMDSLFCT